MKILVSGSSGLIGSALVPFLLGRRAHGGAPRARESDARGGTIRWDPEPGTLDGAAIEGFDAVVHLAGEDLASGTWTAAKKARIRESRVNSTAPPGQDPRLALAPARRDRLARPRSGTAETVVTRSSPKTARSAPDSWRPSVAMGGGRRSREEAGIRVAHLRFGVVLSASGGALSRMLGPFRMGMGGPLGSGSQYVSWLAIDARWEPIGHVLVDVDLGGPVNVASPGPVTQAEFARTLGRVLGRPTRTRACRRSRVRPPRASARGGPPDELDRSSRSSPPGCSGPAALSLVRLYRIASASPRIGLDGEPLRGLTYGTTLEYSAYGSSASCWLIPHPGSLPPVDGLPRRRCADRGRASLRARRGS